MPNACREALHNLQPERGSHAGVILDRYLRTAKDHGEVDKVLKAAPFAARGASGVYQLAFSRRDKWVASGGPALVGFTLATEASQRIVVGLGGESSTEAHVSLHRTYGTPVIPGSAIKGVCAHYAKEVMGLDAPARGVIFGEPHGRRADAGFISFHDAWIQPASLTAEGEGLLDDTMTPHHSDYYAGRPRPDGGGRVDATDFDDPIPVRFLSVRGAFSFVLETIDPSKSGIGWLELTRHVAECALADWGIGAKTSSGYGRLIPVPPPPIPAVKEIVVVTVLPERTKNGSIRVVHEPSQAMGVIQNSARVPADAVARGTLTVRVLKSDPLHATFFFDLPGK